METRPEIEGLRALSILAVLLFHAGVPWLTGGFLGVDVFFVLSGYLVTRIAAVDLAAGRFSAAGFLVRRLRRILPAYLAMLAAVAASAVLFLLPDERADFSVSLLAALGFASNVRYLFELNYFGRDADLELLLHTWSLGVEMQFYVAVAVALWLGMRWREKHGRVGPLAVLASLAVASFLGADLLGDWKAKTAFYLLPTRLFEFLAGACVAFAERRVRLRASNFLAAAGLVLILVSVFAFDAETRFPSRWSLIPVAGTCLVLAFASSGNAVARLLSVGPSVALGRISYSLYLWHWPLLVVVRIISPGEPDPTLIAGAVVLTFPVALLSERFVERPFRSARTTAPRRRLPFGAPAAVVVAGLAGFGLHGLLSAGAPTGDPALERYLAAARDMGPLETSCLDKLAPRPEDHPLPGCATASTPVTGPRTTALDVGILGDSHAGALADGLIRSLADEGLSAYYSGLGGCPGLPGFFNPLSRQRAACDAQSRALIEHFRRSGVRTLIVHARWPLYVSGRPFDNGSGGREPSGRLPLERLDRLSDPRSADDPDRQADILSGFSGVIEELATEFQVVLVYPVPEMGWSVPVHGARRHLLGVPVSDEDLSVSVEAYRARTGRIVQAFDAISDPNVSRVRPADLLCDTAIPGRCAAAIDGRILYFDDDHLSTAGAERVVPAILDAIRGGVADPIVTSSTDQTGPVGLTPPARRH